ncbi:MAG TPA: hypothetical protein VFW88_09985, partial [Burkholderiales bacterium]|nr:hypothetical protein [Burkholderiales bacterium]
IPGLGTRDSGLGVEAAFQRLVKAKQHWADAITKIQRFGASPAIAEPESVCQQQLCLQPGVGVDCR